MNRHLRTLLAGDYEHGIDRDVITRHNSGRDFFRRSMLSERSHHQNYRHILANRFRVKYRNVGLDNSLVPLQPTLHRTVSPSTSLGVISSLHFRNERSIEPGPHPSDCIKTALSQTQHNR